MAGMRTPRGRGAVPPMGKLNMGVLKRLMGLLFTNYKLFLIVIVGVFMLLVQIVGQERHIMH